MKYLISTLGCKVNQYETQAVETLLQQRGHESASPGETADAVIINTCAVTAESGRKSRQVIRRLLEDNPGAVAAVCGCYSQLSPEEVKEAGASVIFGTGDHLGLIEALEQAVETRQGKENIDDPFRRREYEVLPAGAVNGRTRAMLKIQDGCVNFCTYCIIPYTRGRLRSLPLDQAAEETAKIAAAGFREIVLTGIEVASYGVDLAGKPDLADVICACAEKAGNMRIRLGSLEPTVITEDFCRRLAQTDKLCRHFHLSLQSGCDRTLKAMNRKYDTAQFYEAVQLLKMFFPGCALTCDLIVGFPGETEEDFTDTLNFLKKCEFSDMHIFPYSRRPGTPADKMPGQLTNAVKAMRSARAQSVCAQLSRAYREATIGQVLPVLFETEESGFCIGHSDTYLPVRVPGTGLRNRLLQIKIIAADGSELTGEII